MVEEELTLRARALGANGSPIVEVVIAGAPHEAEAVGTTAAERLLAQGADALLSGTNGRAAGYHVPPNALRGFPQIEEDNHA
ncbi:MAG: hypothetical protein Q9O62_08355 [Ardenticatenia bacterium]|nr:hypothetical protein [Ardenticatenia bacterium]